MAETTSRPEDDGSGNPELLDAWAQEQDAFGKLRQLSSDPEAFFREVFAKVFDVDMQKLLLFDDLWKSRTRPSPLKLDSLFMPDFSAETADDSKTWTLNEWVSVFRSACARLAHRNADMITFDKDDVDTLDFVSAAASIRAHIFAIPLQSRFDIKAMAGNIIPAIATTNAIAAGTMIVHARNILLTQKESYCNAYIAYGSRDRVFSKERLCPPSPDCATCSVDRAILKVNTNTFRLGNLTDLVHSERIARLRTAFPLSELLFDLDDLVVIEGARLLLDVDDDAGNAQKTLTSLGITDSKFVRIVLDGLRPLVVGIIHSSILSASEYEVDFDLLEPEQVRAESESAGLGEKRSLPSESGSDSDLLLLSDDEIELVQIGSLDKKAKLERPE